MIPSLLRLEGDDLIRKGDIVITVIPSVNERTSRSADRFEGLTARTSESIRRVGVRLARELDVVEVYFFRVVLPD